MAQLVHAIGTHQFEHELLGYLNHISGADHCAVYRIEAGAPAEIGTASLDGSGLAHLRADCYLRQQYWRRDPALHHAHRGYLGPPVLLHMAIRSLPRTDFREVLYPLISDRVFIAGSAGRNSYTMSVLRSEASGDFSSAGVEELRENSELLLALLGKHAEQIQIRASLPAPAVDNPASVEARIGMRLPRREAQVCARVLLGLSTPQIALDLGIGAESVKTYRKRAYQRLAISSERELMAWFLAVPPR